MRALDVNSAPNAPSYLAAFAISILATLTLLSGRATAADQSAAYYLSRAINGLTSGNYEVAEKHFRSARETAGNTADINLKIGTLYINYADDGYRRALPFFEAAVADDPTSGIARLRLGQAHYQTGDLPRAKQSFESLLTDQQLAPHARYYLGVIALQQRDYDSAENHLSPYTDLPKALQPRARFQMARADFERRQFEKARLGFEAILAEPESKELHPAAESYRDAIQQTTRPWSLHGVATLRYDSNPLVIADDELISQLTGEKPRDDFGLILQGQAGLKLHQAPAFESQASYTLYDLRYDQLSSRNQQGHIVALDGTWFGERVDLDVGYAYEYWSLDSNKFQQANRLSTTLTNRFTPASTTELGYRFSYIDRYDDRSRTGPRHRVHIRHEFPSLKGWQLGLGYRFKMVDTDEVHESRSHELALELNAPAFSGWYASLDTSYDWTRFPDAGSSGHRNRDREWRVTASIVRKLARKLHLRLGASYEENHSDDTLYDYDRYQLDIGLIARF